MIFYLVLGITLRLINAQKHFQIEDIPIENFDFEHGDVQQNAMDIELMPRFQRSFPISEDPKEYFFRSSRSDNEDYGDKYFDNIKDIPRPGGFNSYIKNKEGTNNIRNKREAVESTLLKHDGKERKSIVRRLGKPLELAVIDPESITENPDEISTDLSVIDETSETSNFLINDFIRFKRATTTEKMSEDVLNLKTLMKKIDDENNRKNISNHEPKSVVEEVPPPHTEKLIMDSRDDDKEAARETRGATKDQWVKQVYPVRRNEEQDNSQSSSEHENENIRAPRVHFVTQGMSESAPRPEYNRYDRDARARTLNKELSWNFVRDPYRDMDYYQPRYTRNYIPPSHMNYRNDRYSNYDMREPWNEYEPRSRYYDYPERSSDKYSNYNNYSGSKGRQRRIIYYATLPDLSRTPPNADLRDRYQYRDRYDDRYFTPEPSYQLRRPYTKSRYEEGENRKPPYPLQVSTDVSVREIKKNPERRIYSEVDRNRYAPNPPYQNNRM